MNGRKVIDTDSCIEVLVYDLDKILEGMDKQSSLMSRGQLDISSTDLVDGIDTCFEYDHYHRILVIAQNNNYYVCLGQIEDNSKAMIDDADRYEQLKFTVQKTSILDNHIRSIQLKNLRLYLVDAEYSLVVFTIGVTE